MKKVLLNILFITYSLLSSSQRYDFNWVFGYAGGQGDTRWGTSFVDFNSGNPIVSYQSKGRMYIYEANASISDKKGNLLYYTNGYDVEDASFKKVPGATNLGIRYWDGLVCNQGVMFLNKPNSNSEFFLFFVNKVLSSPNFYIQNLNYLVVDLKNNKVVERTTLLNDTINEGCLTACKHANGSDWWIILNELNTNKFQKFLLSNNGIELIDMQSVGPTIKDGYGQAIFSPNGEYFAILDDIDFTEGLYIKLYKFDRCTGQLDFITIKNYYTTSYSGISFSPNSKYLYYSEQKNLYQIDLSNIQSFDSPELIDTIESQTSWGSQYNLHQLGPDGRIYISNAYSNFVMHRINKPNEKGVACQPRSNSFALKTLGGYGIPNMPNYRLGPLDGSSCDTLGIDNMPWCWWRYDQDTTDYLNFEFTDLSAYEVTDWEWSFGDGVTSNTRNPVHRFTKNGTYEVCLIAKNKNGADTLCRTLNVGTSSIDHVDAHLRISVSPNPCDEYFIINVQDYIPERMSMSLVDLHGRKILSDRLFEGSNGVNTTNISSGVYQVLIMERGVLIFTERIIVAH